MRHLIVVDLETTSLDTATCAVLEVCAIDTVTGEEHHYVPYVSVAQIGSADPKAMQINRYYERGIWEQRLDVDLTRIAWGTLADLLRGNTLGGSNPTFDAAVLARVLGEQVWHHRLADLAAYAAPAMGLGPHELPGLDAVCEHFSVVNSAPHSALGDARATAQCFKLASDRYADMRSQMALSGSQRGTA
jgi:DNA polymerase-3 subunit epsilon